MRVQDDPVVIARHELERQLLEWRDAGGPVYGVRMAIDDLIMAYIKAAQMAVKP